MGTSAICDARLAVRYGTLVQYASNLDKKYGTVVRYVVVIGWVVRYAGTVRPPGKILVRYVGTVRGVWISKVRYVGTVRTLR